jgi:hypothetical protein
MRCGASRPTLARTTDAEAFVERKANADQLAGIANLGLSGMQPTSAGAGLRSAFKTLRPKTEIRPEFQVDVKPATWTAR